MTRSTGSSRLPLRRDVHHACRKGVIVPPQRCPNPRRCSARVTGNVEGNSVKQRWVFAALPVLTLPVLAVSVLAPPAVASALLMFSTPAHAEPMRLAQAMEYGGLPPYE